MAASTWRTQWVPTSLHNRACPEPVGAYCQIGNTCVLRMGWLWLFLVTVSLLGTVSAKNLLTLGSPAECKKAAFVPGYNLGGEGFDIVKMERKGSYVIELKSWDLGNGTCNMVNNGYLNGVKQKLPLALMFWRTLPKCSLKVQSTLYDSSESLVQESTSAVSNSWKTGLDVPMASNLAVGGTHSHEATYAMSKSMQDRYSFSKQEVQCSFYNYKIIASPPLHGEFLQAINSLSQTNDLSSYQEIIDMFGTHYTSGVKMGGKMKSVTAIKTCEASLKGLTDTAVKDCLSVEASATYKVTVKAEFKHCQALKKKLGTPESFSSTFSDRHDEIIGGNIKNEDLFSSKTNGHKQWLESLKSLPDVVSYDLKPLHLLLKETHPARKGLKKAIEKYIKDNSLKKVCSRPCSLGKEGSARDPCNCVCESNQNILANCCPAERGLAELKVFNLRATGLWGDTFSKTDGFVKVMFDNQVRYTAEITDNDNPLWSETFNFGSIKMTTNSKIHFQIYNADPFGIKKILGGCTRYLRSGTVSDMCALNHGTVYFSYTVTCAPGLQGPKCSDHKPSVMDANLAKIFRSRNGILVKDMWKLEQARNPYLEAYHEQ